MDKIRSFILPVVAAIFFLNLAGCANDEETLIVLVFTIFVGGWAIIILISVLFIFLLVYLIVWVLRWYRRVKV